MLETSQAHKNMTQHHDDSSSIDIRIQANKYKSGNVKMTQSQQDKI